MVRSSVSSVCNPFHTCMSAKGGPLRNRGQAPEETTIFPDVWTQFSQGGMDLHEVTQKRFDSLGRGRVRGSHSVAKVANEECVAWRVILRAPSRICSL